MNKQDIEALKDTGLDLSFINKTRVVQVIREAKSLDDATKLMNGLAANGWLRQWDNATHDDGSSWRDNELTKPQEVVGELDLNDPYCGSSNDYHSGTIIGKQHKDYGTGKYSPVFKAPPNYEALVKENERFNSSTVSIKWHVEAHKEMLKNIKGADGASLYTTLTHLVDEALAKDKP